MEPTKEQFYALYYGQSVAYHLTINMIFPVSVLTLADPDVNILHLRDLSTLTDEEYIEVAKITYPNSEDRNNTGDLIGLGKSIMKRFIDESFISYNHIHLTDYLRSRGFILPFMGKSVEDLVKLGWVEIIK